jgi:hypothetical protein
VAIQGTVMVDNSVEYENFLISRIEKCTAVLEGLENNAAFKMLVDDFKKSSEDIDMSWHLETDLNKLNELRITKFATNALISAMQNYRYDLEKATEQLAKLRNSDIMIDKDYDDN